MTLFRRRTALMLAVLLTLVVLTLPALSLPASAAKTRTASLDLSTINKNDEGDGYVWANRTDTLTLNNLQLKTTDTYGLRIPKNATLILKGENYIESASIAVTALGSLTIQGTGSLTLVSGDTGIKMISADTTAALRINGGEFTITTGKSGILSEYPTVAIGNKASFKINITSDDGVAANANILQLNSGAFSANAPITSPTYIKIGACALTLTTKSGAAIRSSEIRINESNKIRAGASETALSAVDAYNGESCVAFEPEIYVRKSILFGDNVSATWDYIALTGAILLLAAVIILPIVHQYRKNKKKVQEVEARRAAERAERKKAIKAAKARKHEKQ